MNMNKDQFEYSKKGKMQLKDDKIALLREQKQ